MAKSVKIADIFIKIGIKADTKVLESIVKQLKEATTQAKAFRKATNKSFKLKGDARALGTLNKKVDGTKKKLVALQKAAAKKITLRTSGMGGRGRGGGAMGAAAGGALGGMGGARGFGGMVAGMSAFGLMASTVNTAQRLQGVRAALTAATGTAERGGDAFAFLRAETERIGVNLLDSSRAFTNLVASGKSVGFSMEQSQELFSATAEAARVLNLSTDDTAGALKAMQQMLSKGTVQSEELKGQLGERLPGAFGMAAQAMGVTTMELGKMLQNGEVLATELLPLLTIELKKFARTDGALEKAMKSNAAEMERMKNSFADMQAEMAKGGFLDAVTMLFRSLAKGMKALIPAFKVLGAVIGAALLPIAAFFELLSTLNELFGQTGVAIQLLATVIIVAMNKTARAFMIAGVRMLANPLVLAIMGIMAAILVIEDFFAAMSGKKSLLFEGIDFEGFSDSSIGKLFKALKELFTVEEGSGMDRLLKLLGELGKLMGKGIFLGIIKGFEGVIFIINKTADVLTKMIKLFDEWQFKESWMAKNVTTPLTEWRNKRADTKDLEYAERAKVNAIEWERQRVNNERLGYGHGTNSDIGQMMGQGDPKEPNDGSRPVFMEVTVADGLFHQTGLPNGAQLE